MTSPAIPKRNSGYQLEIIDGEMLIYHPVETRMLYCNETASLIWQLCDGTHSQQTIIDLLNEAFPEAQATIADDVASTLRQFSDWGAITFD